MKKIDRKALTKRMAQAREQTGLSQRAMADVLEVHINTIGNIERNQVDPFKYVNDWARATGYSPDWLLWGEESLGEGAEERLAKVEEGQERLRAELLEALQAIGAQQEDLWLRLLRQLQQPEDKADSSE